MDNITKRQFRIINILRSNEERLSSEYIAKTIGASSKTIRKDIIDVKDILEKNGATIDSKTGNGYFLIVSDLEKFETFMGKFVSGTREKMIKLPLNYQRAHYIVRRLIASDEYLKINNFSEELYTSRATITQDLQMVRKILKRFNLNLVTRTKYGFKIEGLEQSKRNCFIYEYDYYEENNLNVNEKEYEYYVNCSDDFIKSVVDIFVKTLKSFSFIEISYQNIIRLSRIVYLIETRKKYPLEIYEESVREKALKRTSYKVSTIIAMLCERNFYIKFSEEDLIYFSNCFCGYRNITSYDTLRNRSNYFALYDLAVEIVEYLSDINGFVNMRNDNVLIDSLTRHLLSMKIRCENHIGIHCADNSMKRMSTTGVELAVQTAAFLQQKDLFLNEDEIMFLVYIFTPIFGRYRPKVKKKKIIIISHVSINVGIMLAERFERNFSGYLDSIEVVDIYQLEDLDLSNIDYIFTTLDKKYFKNLSIKIPIIEINTYFPESKKQYLRNLLSDMNDCLEMMERLFDKKCFFNGIKANNKMDVIRIATKKLSNIYHLDDSFEKDLIERDSWLSAETGKNIARVKALKSHGKKSFVSIFILERPILWDTDYVQIFQIWHQGTDPDYNVFAESGYIGNVFKTMFGFGDCSVRMIQNPIYECFEDMLRIAVKEIRSLQLR